MQGGACWTYNLHVATNWYEFAWQNKLSGTVCRSAEVKSFKTSENSEIAEVFHDFFDVKHGSLEFLNDLYLLNTWSKDTI